MKEGQAPRSVSCRALVGQTVRWRAIFLGRVRDVWFSPDLRSAIGVEIECTGGGRRFLSFTACEVDEAEVVATSQHALVGEPALSYYRDRGLSFRALVDGSRGADGMASGRLPDILIGEAGAVEALTADAAGRARATGAESGTAWRSLGRRGGG